MNDSFQKKVKAAAIAGWWVILIAAGFMLLQWILYLLITSTRPDWLLSLVGPDLGWPFLQNLWIWILSIFRLCLWLLVLLVLWLTLWAWQLRK
jgi:hypothetical protein